MCQIPEREDGGELSTAQCKELIKDAARLCPESIVFSGGEPLLRQDIFELIAFVRPFRINTCLTSNGTLVDETTAKQLVSSGIAVVNISIEGPQEVHDTLRGQGTFKKALNAIEILLDHKIETTIATVVCRQNYNFLPDVMDLARRYAVSTVKFQPFNNLFLADKNKENDFLVAPSAFNEVQRSMEHVIELAKGYKIDTNPYDYLLGLPSYLCGLDTNRSQHACRALWTSCPISADGDVYLCWVLADKPLGNVKKGALSEIWNSSQHHRLRQRMLQLGCRGCLMSCYDRNFAPRGYRFLETLKARKLNRFKKRRFYFRVYQYFRYVIGKISRRLFNPAVFIEKKEDRRNKIVEDIQAAKEKLQEKLSTLKDD